VVSRVLVCTGWLVALLALVGVAKLPGPALDIYIHDKYFVVSKSHLILLVLLIFVLPLAALSVRVFRSAH
jgi:heme/copper-type cytochrome/quinol oxidase subunit 1